MAEDNTIAVRFTITGTQQGEFMGAAPTGNKITVNGMNLFRIEASNNRRFRGNFKGHYLASGGYESVAEQFFSRTKATHFLLEYDTERAGDFKPLRFIEDKGVVPVFKFNADGFGAGCSPKRKLDLAPAGKKKEETAEREDES